MPISWKFYICLASFNFILSKSNTQRNHKRKVLYNSYTISTYHWRVLILWLWSFHFKFQNSTILLEAAQFRKNEQIYIYVIFVLGFQYINTCVVCSILFPMSQALIVTSTFIMIMIFSHLILWVYCSWENAWEYKCMSNVYIPSFICNWLKLFWEQLMGFVQDVENSILSMVLHILETHDNCEGKSGLPRQN